MIRLRISELLEEQDKTAYRLALDAEINHGYLWKLKHQKVKTVRLDVIEKLCRTLSCTPGDLLEIVDDAPPAKPARSIKKQASKKR